MRFLKLFLVASLFFSCEKESCTKAIFSPVGFALENCSGHSCQQTKPVEIDGKTVCACLTGHISQELPDGENVDIDQRQSNAIAAADAIANDSIRLNNLAMFLAFGMYVDCTRR